MRVIHLAKDIIKKTAGVSATSYGLLVGLIAVGAIAVVDSLGENVTSLFNTVADATDPNADSGSGDAAPQQAQAPSGPEPTITVDTGDDIVNAGDGVTSFREAIEMIKSGAAPQSNTEGDGDLFSSGVQSSSSVIGFDPSVSVVTLNSPIDVDGGKTYTVNGESGITITGNDSTNHFYVTGGSTLTIYNANLTNGYNSAGGFDGGGSINAYGSATVNLTDVDITNSEAAVYGGAIRMSGTVTLNMSGGSMTGNTSGSSGGAIYGFGVNTVTLDNVNISNNNAGNYYGGGVYMGTYNTGGGGSLTITDSTISGNTVTGSFTTGGGLAVNGGFSASSGITLSMSNTSVTNNSSSHYAGGVYVGSISDNNPATYELNLDNVTITGNSAGSDAGLSTNRMGDTRIVNSTISNNDSTNIGSTGGFVFSNNGGVVSKVVIDNSHFDNNDAISGNGGGAYIQVNGTANITITDSTFNNNGVGRHAGGITSQGGGDGFITLTNVSVDGNYSPDNLAGGMTFAMSGSSMILTINGTSSISNNVGGRVNGLYVNGTNAKGYLDGVTIANNMVTFPDNTSGTVGGLNVKNANVQIDNSSVTGNTVQLGAGVNSHTAGSSSSISATFSAYVHGTGNTISGNVIIDENSVSTPSDTPTAVGGSATVNFNSIAIFLACAGAMGLPIL